MATSKVTVDLEFTGAEEATAQAETFGHSLEGMNDQAVGATNSLGQAAGAIGNVGSVVGSVNPAFARVAGTIGQVGSAVSALSSGMGPLGVAIAAVTVAMAAYKLVTEQLAEAQGGLAAANDDVVESLDGIIERTRRLAGMRRQEALVAEGLAGREAQRAAFEQAEDARSRIAGALAVARGDVRRGESGQRHGRQSAVEQTREARLRAGLLEAQLEQQQHITDRLRRDAETAQSDFEARSQEEAEAFTSPDAPAARGRRGGGRGRGSGKGRGPLQTADKEGEINAAEKESVRELMAIEDELAERRQQHAEEQRDALDAVDQKRQELADGERTRLEEQAAAENAQIQKQLDAEQRAADESMARLQAQADEFQEFTQPILTGLVDAFKSIAAGTETAEDAFKNLLSGFLDFIAIKTATAAAEQFAQAIAAFAEEQYDKGALHLAAGAAYTAVAVAAGAASGALSGASGAAPSNPSRSASDRGGGGDNTTIVNFQGNVVTAGTRAELGRDLRGLLADGDRRYEGRT